jgi:hypothetical protein
MCCFGLLLYIYNIIRLLNSRTVSVKFLNFFWSVLWRTKNFERLVISLTYKCKTGFMVN